MEILPATGANILLSNGDNINTHMDIGEIAAIYGYCQAMGHINRVKAIKFARAEFGCGLREAKYFVDDAREEEQDDEGDGIDAEAETTEREFRLLSEDEIQHFCDIFAETEPLGPEDSPHQGKVTPNQGYADALKESGYRFIGPGLVDDDVPF